MQDLDNNTFKNNIPNLINSEIVPQKYDEFWDEPSCEITNPEAEILVLTRPYDQGSSQEEQLTKLLNACNLTKNQQTVQIPENQNIAYSKLKQKFNLKSILLIGVHPKQLGISALFRLNEINRFDNLNYIPTQSLEELESNPDLKKALWVNALKPLFANGA